MTELKRGWFWGNKGIGIFEDLRRYKDGKEEDVLIEEKGMKMEEIDSIIIRNKRILSRLEENREMRQEMDRKREEEVYDFNR